MRRIFLLLVLFVSFSFSAIDECKTDVYFGNGILTTPAQARYNAYVMLQSAVMSLYASEVEYKKHIGKVDYAYNSTLGRAHDMLEAYIQLDREAPDFFDSLRGFFRELTRNEAPASLCFIGI